MSDILLLWNKNTISVFLFWVLHPVTCIIKAIRSAIPRNNFSNMFIHIYLLSLHVSALVGHLQEEYTIIAEVIAPTTDPLLCVLYVLLSYNL
jgi:hypothetical protein